MARGNAQTDFQRNVLADDAITDEEFREVRQRYIDCLADAGIRAEALDNGGYNIYDSLSGNRESLEMQCSDSTLRGIESLYYAIRVNPQNEDFTALLVECLQHEGVVDTSFTTADWQNFEAAFAAAANELPEGTRESNEGLPALPGGQSMDDPTVQKCMTNPLGL